MKSVLSAETVHLEAIEIKMSNFNPSVHHQGVVAAVQIKQPCGVSPAVELILQTDWLYFVNTAAG